MLMLSRLKVPVREKVSVPATAVRVTFWPVMLPVTPADPALHGPVVDVDDATE
jgi:hypothetical protein